MKKKSNSGKTLVSIIGFFNALEIIACLILGFALIFQDMAFWGITVIIAGIVLVFLSSIFYVAFAELVDSNCRIADMMEDFLATQTAKSPKSQSADLSIKILEQWRAQDKISAEEFVRLAKIVQSGQSS